MSKPRLQRVVLGLMLVLGVIWLTSDALSLTDAEVSNSGVAAIAEQAEPQGAAHAEPPASHGNQVSGILVAVALILLVAKLGGHIFESFKMPAVLGELVGGILLGNLVLIGLDAFEFLRHEVVLDSLAEIGIIFLLFTIGLESDLRELVKVGLSSLLVATLGVIAPFFLGFFVSRWFLPESATLVHIFIGATLTATSVGITARVLMDIGKLNTDEARIILGAAVIDDVLGLLILAVVSGTISATNAGGTFSASAVLMIVFKALMFFVCAIVMGLFVSPQLFKIASRLRGGGMLLATALVFCFGLSYLAAIIGLAPIVGAFAAGLALDEVHYKDFLDRGEHKIEEVIAPITAFMVPIFFVMMGVKVDLSTLARVDILGFAVVLTIVAVIGKQACALGVLEKGANRTAVGLGMIPRGEVGLIFAGIGASLYLAGERVIVPSVYSAVVFMVIVTTLVTPPLLSWSLARGDRARAALKWTEQDTGSG